MKKVFLYTKFNRFWHWMQALFIILLAVTGFEIHGTFTLFGYNAAFRLHNILAWSLIILTAFAIFWHITTGQWKQYIPTRKFLKEMIRFYLSGIFKGEPHPVKKTEISKLNPLQRITYTFLKTVIIPLQILTGVIYFFYNSWGDIGLSGWTLGPVAMLHTLGAFLLSAFAIIHIYLTTTGETLFSNIKAMITGWERVEDHAES